MSGDSLDRAGSPPPSAAGGSPHGAGAADAAAPVHEIKIQVRTISRLFNSFDPSPFHERDIDEDAERYIADWARELPRDATFRIVVQLPPEEGERAEAAALPEAIAHYFDYRANEFDADLRELFRIGRRSLQIGFAVLCVSLIASQMLATAIPQAAIARVLEESLIIVGWVANWRPIEIYLYDWWPIVRRRRLYRRIAAAPITVRAQ